MKKIGIIDSGIGGLSILQDLFKQHFNAKYFYISDHKNMPYGGKSQEFMLERTSQMIEILKEKNVDLILLACNTLTVNTIKKLRELYRIPFVGIEPYINYVNIHRDQNSKSALIVTPATYNSDYFKKQVLKFDPHGKIDIFPLDKLALLIQQITSDTCLSDIKDDINKELQIINKGNYTDLILGCTHYPLIKKYLANYLNLSIVDPHEAVAIQVGKVAKLAVTLDSLNYDDSFSYDASATGQWREEYLSNFKIFH